MIPRLVLFALFVCNFSDATATATATENEALAAYHRAATQAYTDPDGTDFDALWSAYLDSDGRQGLEGLHALMDGLIEQGVPRSDVCAERWNQVEAARGRLLWSLYYQYVAMRCAEALEREVDADLRERMIAAVLGRLRATGDGTHLLNPMAILTIDDVYVVAALGELQPMGLRLVPLFNASELIVELTVKDEIGLQSKLYFDALRLPLEQSAKPKWLHHPGARRGVSRSIVNGLVESGFGPALAMASRRARANQDWKEANELRQRAMEAGEASVALELGEELLFHGEWKKVQEQGLDILIEMAEAGWGEAAALLSVAYRRGHRVEKDADAEAALRGRALNSLGTGPGLRHMGSALLRHGGPRDYETVIRDYEAAADAGDAMAAMNLYHFAGRPWASKHVSRSAREYLERAAEFDYPFAWQALAEALLDEGSQDEAWMWYTKAADAGLPEANWKIAERLLAELESSQEPSPEIRSRIEAAAARGHPDALWHIAQARLAVVSEDDEEEFAEASGWVTEAAIHGHGEAATWFARRLLEGDPNRKARRNAQTILEPLAKEGQASAQRVLGTLLERHQPKKARLWYAKAAAQGDAEAMLGLGRMMRLGRGGARDSRKAREWLEKAVEAGVEGAEIELAEFSGRRK